jgi:hypothetical protein
MNYTAYLNRLSKACEKHDLSLKTAGSVGGSDIKTFKINPGAKKRICLIGGIHGDETGGPHGILYWLENYSLPNRGIDVLPLVNPYGYTHDQRYNKDYDMNRQWTNIKNLKDENKIIYNSIKDTDYELMFTVHEDPGQEDGFYLYTCERSRVVLWKKCISLAKKYFKIYDKDFVWGDPIVDGIGWHDALQKNKDSKCVENWFYNNKNIPYLTTEASDAYPLKEREKFFAELIDLVCKEY